jgi:hypothetical protein
MVIISTRRTTNSKPQTNNSKPQTTNSKPQTTNQLIMEFTNLPKEVRIIICEFNSDHKDLFNDTIDVIAGTVLLSIFNSISRNPEIEEADIALNEDRETLAENILFNDSARIFKYLNNCPCCSRHKIDKPYAFEPFPHLPQSQRNYEESQIDTLYHNEGYSTHGCRCKCRHLARHLCHTYAGSD